MREMERFTPRLGSAGASRTASAAWVLPHCLSVGKVVSHGVHEGAEYTGWRGHNAETQWRGAGGYPAFDLLTEFASVNVNLKRR